MAGLPVGRQACRRAQFWSRGAKSDNGNQHARIAANGEGFTLSIATLPMVNGRLQYFIADLWVPEKHRDLVRESLSSTYSVRLMRRDNSKDFHVHITVREQVTGEVLDRAPAKAVVGGLDCNTDCLALAVVSPQGNLLSHHTVWMRDLPDARSDTATQLISNGLDEALDFLGKQGVSCLVVERLKFAQDHDTHRRFNRATTRFRSTMVELAVRKALRRGLAVVQVNPAYTSWIGQLKYAPQYGVSTHVAAAYVAARRGLGLQERVPKELVASFPAIVELLQADVAELESKLGVGRLSERVRKRLARQLENRRQWIRRLTDWKSCSPEAGRPWLLWATLRSASGVSGVREVLFGAAS